MIHQTKEEQTKLPDGIQIDSSGLVTLTTPNKMGTIRVRAIPLPEEVTRLLDKNAELIRTVEHCNLLAREGKALEISSKTLEDIRGLKAELEKHLQGRKWRNTVERIWAFGPRRYGPNILLNNVEGYQRPSVWQFLCLEKEKSEGTILRDFDNSISSGFQLATLSGPMCEEPLMGVCFSMESWDMKIPSQTVQKYSQNDSLSQQSLEENYNECVLGEVSETLSRRQDMADCYGPFSGHLIASMKEACRYAFQAKPQRLMAAMYTCEIMATAEVLGKQNTPLKKKKIQPERLAYHFNKYHDLQWNSLFNFIKIYLAGFFWP